MWAGRYWGGRFFGGRYWGKVGLTVPGYFWSGRYLGSNYWGLRYWGKAETSIPFEITQTTGLSLTGTLLTSGGAVFGTPFEITQTRGLMLNGSLALSADLAYPNEDFAITPPLELGGLTGTLSIACDLVYGGAAALPSAGYWGRRYWGANYFSPRYWGTGAQFAITQTSGVGLSGMLTATAGLSQTIALHPSTLALSGTLGLGGDMGYSVAADGDIGGAPRGLRFNKRKRDDTSSVDDDMETMQLMLLVASAAADELFKD